MVWNIKEDANFVGMRCHISLLDSGEHLCEYSRQLFIKRMKSVPQIIGYTNCRQFTYLHKVELCRNFHQKSKSYLFMHRSCHALQRSVSAAPLKLI